MADTADSAAGAASAPPSNEVQSLYRPWLHLYALLLVTATFVLIAIGGTVTSKGAGMAVPDWPTTFGYNMFLAPLHVWWEHSDRFWEHFHRLMGSLVGFMTIIMMVWLWIAERRRLWLPIMGTALLLLVSIQGIMGGLRVTEISITLAMIHGITGQLILGLVVLFAVATSKPWLRLASKASDDKHLHPPASLKYLPYVLLGILVVQLALGAWMRHKAAGLAIPDFPASYGQVIPPLTQDGINQAVEQRQEALGVILRPYSVKQVAVHFAHRVWAIVVTAVSLWLVIWLRIRTSGRPETRWPGRWLLILLAVQILLGASVIWSGRYPEIATAHQAVGAAVLAVAVWLAIRVQLIAQQRQPGQGLEATVTNQRASSGPAIKGQAV